MSLTETLTTVSQPEANSILISSVSLVGVLVFKLLLYVARIVVNAPVPLYCPMGAFDPYGRVGVVSFVSEVVGVVRALVGKLSNKGMRKKMINNCVIGPE